MLDLNYTRVSCGCYYHALNSYSNEVKCFTLMNQLTVVSPVYLAKKYVRVLPSPQILLENSFVVLTLFKESNVMRIFTIYKRYELL